MWSIALSVVPFYSQKTMSESEHAQYHYQGTSWSEWKTAVIHFINSACAFFCLEMSKCLPGKGSVFAAQRHGTQNGVLVHIIGHTCAWTGQNDCCEKGLLSLVALWYSQLCPKFHLTRGLIRQGNWKLLCKCAAPLEEDRHLLIESILCQTEISKTMTERFILLN